MKTHVRISLVLTVVLVALGLVIAGCDLGGNGDGATNKITGVVRDSASGELVAAVTVSFGSSSTTTSADGSYSLDLGASSGVVTGDFSVYGSGYTSLYAEQVPVDASQSTSLTVYVDPIDISGYTTNQFDLTILDQYSTEIPDGSDVFAVVMNSNGGYSRFWIIYANPGTNTVDSATFGSDCLIAASVDTGTTEFVAMAEQVDLSAASSNQTLSGTAGTSVSVTPDAPNYYGMLALQTPYGGQFTVWEDVVPSSPEDVTIYNPYNYEGLWGQMAMDTSPLDSDIMYVSTSQIGSIGDSVTLPAINAALGPTGGYPAGYSMSYSGGTLSYGAVSGASFYLIWVYDQATPEAHDLAWIMTDSTSFTLPSWLVTDLSGTTADVILSAVNTVGASVLTAFSRLTEWPPEIQQAFALRNGGMGPEEGYEQTINF